METAALQKLLREFVTGECIGSFRENSVAVLRDALPSAEMSALWLQQLVAPLTPFARTRLWLALAYCGRKELLPLLRAEVNVGKAEDRLRAATALTLLDEGVGLSVLEALFREVRKKGDTSVPLDWITEDCLLREVATPGALLLRAQLRAEAGWDGLD